MKLDERIITNLNELIELGEKVRSTRQSPPRNVITSDFVDTQLANQWFTRCQNLLGRVFGEESIHFKNFSRYVTEHPDWPAVNNAFGVLKAAKEDFEQDALFEVREMVKAEIFDDFLDQANHLLNSGYFAPAAVIAGAVLEDGLRKLCERSGITLPERPKLDRMNSELAKNDIYKKLTQKQITTLADIRNNAAHGNWSEFDTDDVEDMIRKVREFMERFFQ